MTTKFTLELVVKTSKEGNALRNTQRQLTQLNNKVESGGAKWATFAGVAASVSSKIIDSVVAMGRKVAEQVSLSIDAFESFDESTREIGTLIPNLDNSALVQLQDQAQQLQLDTGRLSEETLPALYQAISLGIDPSNVFAQVELASEAARAGAAELTPTLVAGQSVVNAFGEDVIDLEHVFDLMFLTVKDGATTIPELSANLSEVTSVAGETGVVFEDISAALVTMTKQGDSTSEATGLLSNLLIQLSISTSAAGSAFKEAAGVGFKEFLSRGNSLADAMQVLNDHAQATGQGMLDMLGGDSPFFRDIQAARGAVELTGRQMENFAQQTERTTEATGGMAQAAEIMGESSQRNADAAAAAMEVLQQTAGEAFVEIKGQVLEALIPSFESLLATIEETGPGIVELGETFIPVIVRLSEMVRLVFVAADRIGGLAASYRALTNQVEKNDSAVNNANIEAIRAADSYDAYREAVFASGGAIHLFSEDVFDSERALLAQDVAVTGGVASFTRLGTSIRETATPALVSFTAAQIASAEASDRAMISRLASSGFLESQSDRALAAADAELALAEAEKKAADEARSLVNVFQSSSGITDELLTAQSDLASGAEDSSERVTAANQAIEESYRRIAFEALLAQAAAGDISLQMATDLGVALGLLTPQQAAFQVQVATTTQEINRLTSSQQFLNSETAVQVDALNLLTEGYTTSAVAALALATGSTTVSIKLGEAAAKTDELKSKLEDFPNDIPINFNISVTGDPIPDLGNGRLNQGGQQAVNLNKGGVVPFLPGSQRGRDSVPALLTPGEVILSEPMVRRGGGASRLLSLLNGRSGGSSGGAFAPQAFASQSPVATSEGGGGSDKITVHLHFGAPNDANATRAAQTFIDIIGNSLR